MGNTHALSRRDFYAITLSLSGVTIICWAYLMVMARGMSTPEYLDMAALQIPQWSRGYFWMMLSMRAAASSMASS